MQIWKSVNIQYVKDFTLKHTFYFLHIKFVYKHLEAKEYVKN